MHAGWRRRLNWQTATVVELLSETPHTKTIVLEVPKWAGHRAGQHVDVRLSPDHAHRAQRSYSIASAPEDDHVTLTVERLERGTVSPYLVDQLRIGDELHLRGPIGGYFVWDEPLGGPLLLIADGSGLVPFRSMLRHHRAIRSRVPVRLLCSAQSLPLLVYRRELLRVAAYDEVDVSVTLTGEQPHGWHGYRGPIDTELLAEVAWPSSRRPLVYVCGSTDFVETMARLLVAQGHEASRMRTERFGGTRTYENG